MSKTFDDSLFATRVSIRAICYRSFGRSDFPITRRDCHLDYTATLQLFFMGDGFFGFARMQLKYNHDANFTNILRVFGLLMHITKMKGFFLGMLRVFGIIF